MIDDEIKRLDEFINEKTEPYKANLFADITCCDVIISSITEAKKLLEDAQIKLDKQKARYH